MVEQEPNFPAEKETGRTLHHVALIMDGNRRWAKLHNKPIIQGHEEGKRRMEPIVKRAMELGIDVVTFYTFSLENFERSEEEVAGLLQVLRREFNPLMERLKEENVRFHFLGNISHFPLDLQDNFRKAEHSSKEKNGITINLALAYEGRNEIIRALKQIVSTGVREEDITEQLVRNYLDTAGQPDPDLVIRTGGRSRLSGYLPWQIVYSEIYFSNVLWPDFTIEEFNEAILWYKEQIRTFGR